MPINSAGTISSQLEHGVNWPLLVTLAFIILLLGFARKWADLTLDQAVRILGEEFRKILRLDPTMGAINALGIVAFTLLIFFSLTLGDFEQLVTTSAHSAPTTNPSVSLKLGALLIGGFLLACLTIISILSVRGGKR